MNTRLILPALLLLSACATDPVQQFTEARQSFAEQDFDTARVLLTASLQDQPGNRDALALLVQTYLRLGDGDAAQGTIARLRSAGAAGPELTRYEAEAALLRGLPRKALDLIGLDQSPDGWRIKAAAHLDNGQADLALQAFEHGLATGKDARLVHDFARFLLGSGDFAGAAEQLAALERIEPGALATAMLKGDILVARQQYQAGLDAYRAAAGVSPHRIEPLLGQATALGLLGKKSAALAALESAARLKPDDGRVIALQVQQAAETGNWAKVRAVLQPIEGRIAPMSVENLTYAEALLRLGQAEQARSRFARAHLVAPGNPYARLMLAASLMQTGDPAGALDKIRPLADSALAAERELSLAEAAARAAGDAVLADGYAQRLANVTAAGNSTAISLADGAFAKGDFAAAIAAYRGLPGFERDPEVLRRLAMATSHLGRHAEAIALADQALALAPDNPNLKHAAGFVRLHERNSLPHALGLLEAAVAADSDNREFQRDLAKAKAAAG